MYKVLAADGDPLAREGLRSLIDRIGGFRTVHCVGDGETAVAACAAEPVDIAFLSLALPRRSGVEAAKGISEIQPGIPIVFMGLRETLDLTRETSGVTISGYLAKPVSPTAVMEILDRHRSLHTFGLPKTVDALAGRVMERDFQAACAAISLAADDIRKQAGHDPRQRRDVLTRANGRLLRALNTRDGGLKSPPPLPLPEEETLTAERGVDLALFHSVDAVFKRNCEAANPVLAKAFAFIDDNLKNRIGLEDIVAHCAASQTHISRVFKKHFGMSVMDYLHLRKIHVAKAMFVFSGMSAAEAAHLLGYNEAGYFSKVFKKYEGTTVQQYKGGK